MSIADARVKAMAIIQSIRRTPLGWRRGPSITHNAGRRWRRRGV